MTCPHCVTLQTRITQLEKALGVRRYDQEIGMVSGYLRVNRTQARLLLRLYAADDGWVKHGSLMDEISTDSIESLKVQVSKIRNLVRARFDVNPIIAGYHGSHVYGLTHEGRQVIRDALDVMAIVSAA